MKKDNNFKDVLWDFRKTHRLTQEKLANILGVSRQSVNCWERGEFSPTRKHYHEAKQKMENYKKGVLSC